MSSRTLGHIFLGSSLLLILTEPSTYRSGQPSKVRVLVERVERVSSDEVHFRVRITNRSERLVFLTGIIFESRSQLDPIYLEQQREAGDSKIVVSCMDTPLFGWFTGTAAQSDFSCTFMSAVRSMAFAYRPWSVGQDVQDLPDLVHVVSQGS